MKVGRLVGTGRGTKAELRVTPCTWLGLGLPEQAVGWLPIRFGIGSQPNQFKL
jgi:hypothetical protein